MNHMDAIFEKFGKRPSEFQAAIFDFITNGRGDGVVQAVAGSGKTSTLEMAASLLRSDSALFLSFNKHIAEELGTRIRGMDCRTIHSIGFSALQNANRGRKYKVVGWKYRDIVKDLIIRRMPEMTVFYKGRTILTQEGRTLADTVVEYVNFCRLTLTSPTSVAGLERMGEFYDLDDLDAAGLGLVRMAISNGELDADERYEIDFTDMVYLPIAWNLPMSTLYEWIFVDESQDLNAAQLEVALRHRAAGGRMLFVGDRSQSIYGFSGATPDSIDQIIRRTEATELPLSVCYRCPNSHVALAQEIVPQITAAPWAIEGELGSVSLDGLFKMVGEGDLVLCRKTAPLVGLCLELIACRIPARVRGHAIGEKLAKVIDEIAAQPHFRYEALPEFAGQYRRTQIAKLSRKENNEARIERLGDELDAIEAAYMGFDCDSVDCLKAELAALFTDKRASVWLSTVHRAKGLEADRVFILEPENLPLVWKGQMAWQFDQEMNLRYVALTRAKQALYFVTPVALVVNATLANVTLTGPAADEAVALMRSVAEVELQEA